MKKVSKVRTKEVLGYEAIIEKDEMSGYWARVPALQGCYTQGETLNEVCANLQEAIELCLEDSK